MKTTYTFLLSLALIGGMTACNSTNPQRAEGVDTLDHDHVHDHDHHHHGDAHAQEHIKQDLERAAEKSLEALTAARKNLDEAIQKGDAKAQEEAQRVINEAERVYEASRVELQKVGGTIREGAASAVEATGRAAQRAGSSVDTAAQKTATELNKLGDRLKERTNNN